MSTKSLYTIRKYDGDDRYSYAVFLKSDLPKGRRGVIFYGEAKPRYCGLSRDQANYYKGTLDKKASPSKTKSPKTLTEILMKKWGY